MRSTRTFTFLLGSLLAVGLLQAPTTANAAPVARTSATTATHAPQCIAPNPAEACRLIVIRNGVVVSPHFFSAPNPVWLQFDVTGGAVDITVKRSGVLWFFTNGCSISCGADFSTTGNFAVFLNTNTSPSARFCIHPMHGRPVNKSMA